MLIVHNLIKTHKDCPFVLNTLNILHTSLDKKKTFI